MMRDTKQPQPVPVQATIDTVRSAINEARTLPMSDLCKAGNYKSNPQLRYPQTRSEHIVSNTLHLLLQLDPIEENDLLDEICSVFGSLDQNVNQPMAWKKLFDLETELPHE